MGTQMRPQMGNVIERIETSTSGLFCHTKRRLLYMLIELPFRNGLYVYSAACRLRHKAFDTTKVRLNVNSSWALIELIERCYG